MIRCRNCDLEIEEREIEANDGCCPECGAPIFIDGLSDEDEEERKMYDEDEDEEQEDEFGEDDGDGLDDDDFGPGDDDGFQDEEEIPVEEPPAPKRRGRKKKNS